VSYRRQSATATPLGHAIVSGKMETREPLSDVRDQDHFAQLTLSGVVLKKSLRLGKIFASNCFSSLPVKIGETTD
jgi:hypothetical protein